MLIESISNGSTFKEIYKKDMDKLDILINKEMLYEFMKNANPILEYYDSILRENNLIEELKSKIMRALFM